MQSADEIAQQILQCCLDGVSWWPESLEELLRIARDPDNEKAQGGSRALFGILVEGLSDRFDARLVPLYSRILSIAIAGALPEFTATELIERYERIRRPQPFATTSHDINRVYVLSRVTLGADIAVTSVMLDALQRRFPHAEICYAGPRKGWELFEGDPRILHFPVAYGRSGTLIDRFSAAQELRAMLWQPGSIVVDPDSRLTQLGLIPVCHEQDYFFFESRSYGQDTSDSLSVLAARWCFEVFGIRDAKPYLAPREWLGPAADITISLGVGGNPTKRVADPFEKELLALLVQTGRTILIDRGAGGEEAHRVDQAIASVNAAPGQIRTWDGAFAPFAAQIARSKFYAGYDSAGQHAAAAAGIPLITIFTGFPSERMFQRWTPTGTGPINVIRVDREPPDDVIVQVRAALAANPITIGRAKLSAE